MSCSYSSLTPVFRPPRLFLLFQGGGGGNKSQASANSNIISMKKAEEEEEGRVVVKKKEELVGILWDLDSNPPRGPPYRAALSLKKTSQQLGSVVHTSAFSYPNSFSLLPNSSHHLHHPNHYLCGLCGRLLPSPAHLRSHFSLLHTPLQIRKSNSERALRKMRRKHCRNNFLTYGDFGYMEMMPPKIGCYLVAELKQAMFCVDAVGSIPMAAQVAVKGMRRRGVRCLVLVSDNSDLNLVVRMAKEYGFWVVVVGDVKAPLSRFADFWMPWIEVECGEGLSSGSVPIKRYAC